MIEKITTNRQLLKYLQSLPDQALDTPVRIAQEERPILTDINPEILDEDYYSTDEGIERESALKESIEEGMFTMEDLDLAWRKGDLIFYAS